MKDEILVSVFCIAYNQEKYIRKTLEGFVNQKTDFLYEVFVHDDASSDNTPNIILEYAERYPDLIKPILQTENQYSKGLNPNDAFIYPKARGRYFAFCEGDDYWTDSNKLQIQFEALEKHPECSFCVHDIGKIYSNGEPMNDSFPGIELKEGVIPADEFLRIELVEHAWLFQTSSFFVRKSIYDKFISDGSGYTALFPVGDKPILLFMLTEGDCYYIKKNMSIYRTSSGGVLTVVNSDIDRKIKFNQRFVEGYKAFNEYTNNKYSQYVDYRILLIEAETLRFEGKYRELLGKKYRCTMKQMNPKWKIIILLGVVAPNLVKKLMDKVL